MAMSHRFYLIEMKNGTYKLMCTEELDEFLMKLEDGQKARDVIENIYSIDSLHDANHLLEDICG